MRDARTCRGFEKSFATCDELPSCTQECEPRQCQFSAWAEWYDAGGCSGLCLRHRGIQISSNECGAPCVGPQIESKACEKEACILESQDCSLSVWSDWSGCGSEVDQKYRHRSVLAQPKGYGMPCGGNLNETSPCDARHPVDCLFAEWGQWTECSASCGGGYHAAVRRVISHAEHGGKACDGTLRKTKPCNEQPCSAKVADCEVGEWGEWLGCNFASPQQRYRTRDVTTPAFGGGKACSDVMKQTMGCPQEEPQDCEFSEWSEWGSCDVECGGGQTFRKRTLAVQPEHGGSCSRLTNLTETASCNMQPCYVAKACSLSFWSEWTSCSASCDTGMRQRSREMIFGEDRRLSLFDVFADSMVKAQQAPPMEDCGAGFSGGLREVEPCVAAACARQDCTWGVWTEWSACTCSCGGGTTRRSRVVAKPPGLGGQPCEPDDMSEIGACNTHACDECVDGAWGEWSEWSTCSSSCGGGFRSRHRDVARHPNQCGKPVAGVEDDFDKCEAAEACVPDVDCELSAWTAWTSCSNECYGVSERHRSVVSFPSGRGQSCEAEALKEMEMCNPGPGGAAPAQCEGAEAPTPCQLSVWGDWGSCSATCDDGQRVRLRHILSPATKGGELCDGSLSETHTCSALPCPVHECEDCRYGEWTEWGACSKCGGQRYRHRSIAQMPNECGKPCEVQETKQAGECTSECEEEHWCSWSEWSSFGDCSAECGPATQSRQRVLAIFKEQPADHLFSGSPGMTCQGMQLETAACEFHSCEAECQPTDCVLSEWTEWSSPSCSQLCERSRIVQTESKCSGQACSGHLEETKRCDHECQKVQDCVLSNWGAWSECKDPQDQKYRKRAIQQEAANGGAPCQGGLAETQFCSTPGLPTPCELSGWSAWSACTKSCLGGLKQRTRAVRRTASNGGEPCSGAMEELAVCGEGFCSGDVKDCAVGAWSEWSSCTHGGQRSRSRAVEAPTNGGVACEASLHEIQECSQASDCKLSDWSEWDTCDKTCAGGQQGRQRQVVQNPRLGGKACEPSLMETRGCNEEPCNKVDCLVSEWGAWSPCSASCGPGQRSRDRKVLQEPQDGGLGCGLELSQLEACSSQTCEYVDCLWSDWNDWSACSCECDGGQRTRTRSVSRFPEKGGKPCVPLSKEEVAACNTEKCGEQSCVDGAWGEWGEWERCSKSCDGGLTWRTREVAVEANHCGKPALGDARVYASCNEDKPCEESVDCEFAEWGEWSACTSECDGVRRRSREVAVEGRGKGKFCIGAMKETAPCNPLPGMPTPQACQGALPQDCLLSQWAQWEACSASCGGGSQVRHRQVLSEPKSGGASCEEVLSEIQGCARGPCSAECQPQDCAWGEWAEWSACDKCGGQMRRFRHIVKEANCGGATCDALASEETANCTRQCHAPAYCMWGDWKEWSACSASCGSAEKSRTRHLQVTPGPAGELLEDFDLSAGVDEGLLQDKVEGLQKQALGMRTRRLQELFAAFAAGGLTLVVGFAAVRRAGARKEFTRLGAE